MLAGGRSVRSRPGGNSRLNGWGGNAHQVVDEISTLVIAILGIMRDADDRSPCRFGAMARESDGHHNLICLGLDNAPPPTKYLEVSVACGKGVCGANAQSLVKSDFVSLPRIFCGTFGKRWSRAAREAGCGRQYPRGDARISVHNWI
jgi:hypothetical protein